MSDWHKTGRRVRRICDRLGAAGVYDGAVRWVLAGDRMECPCCGGRYRRFLTAGPTPRPNVKCPGCGARERLRLLWLYLTRETDVLTRPQRLLHFAPEPFLAEQFQRCATLAYTSVDLMAPRVNARMDITSLAFPSDAFDAILCVHVLEHIPDDRAAMGELYRVMKPGGWGILQVPMDPAREQTDEDPTVTDPEERLRRFGQSDHVRMYGRDYGQRLIDAGFRLEVLPYARRIGKDTAGRYGLAPDEDLYLVRKS